MTQVPPQLTEIRRRVSSGSEEDFVVCTPREILSWFGFERRTWRHVSEINAALSEMELLTMPNYVGIGIDDPFYLGLDKVRVIDNLEFPGETTTTTPDPNKVQGQPDVSQTPQMPADPVHRVARFLAKSVLVSVSRDESIQVAITQMLLHDFSQLPVMQGERNVVGMISWHSIGKRRAMGLTPEYVRDSMEPSFEVKGDDSIFDAIRVIQEHDCVLVRGAENKIIGILTAADISSSFEQLSRPFLLLSYIENHLRALIHPNFTVEELQSAKDPSDVGRTIVAVSDMTFGEYIRLLENPANWGKLKISIDRNLFIAQLNEVREIRNDVMHFNPEGIEDKDMETFRRFNSFLQSIVSLLPKR